MVAALYVCLLMVAFTAAPRNTEGITVPKDGYFNPEMPCSRKGGICILDEECDSPEKDITACPEQRASGAVCCNQLPKSETRCQKLGGECFAKGACPRRVISKAADCQTDQTCCLLE